MIRFAMIASYVGGCGQASGLFAQLGRRCETIENCYQPAATLSRTN
jgi:hypothetical protein